MIIKKADSFTDDTLIDILSSGGTAIVPCDTIYGIVGISPDTEERIRQIKRSSSSKHFIRLIGTTEQLKQFTDICIETELLSLWPGPLTLVVPTYHGNTIGLRVPDDPYLQQLLSLIKKPLISTSVNRSGCDPLENIDTIIENFEKDVDLIVDGGDLKNKQPSTVLDVTEKPYKILRNGSINIPASLLTN
jgi:L-threonylcarbamoyladenylate synthase